MLRYSAPSVRPSARLLVAFAALLLPIASHALAGCPPDPDGGWGERGGLPAAYGEPSGIATDESGRVYTVDRGSEHVRVYNADGSFVTSWGGSGTNPGQFSDLLGIAVRGGFVWTTQGEDHGVARLIQKFTTDGTFVAWFGRYGNVFENQFAGPLGIDIAADGSLYIADHGNDRIHHHAPNGDLLHLWSVPVPTDVAVGPDGDVYVSRYDGVIARYTATGAIVSSWTGGTAGSLLQPPGLDVDEAGRVYVADRGHDRVVEFSGTGQVVSIWQGGLFYTEDVARGPNGRIYVLNYGSPVIRRYIARDNDNCEPPPPPATDGNGVAILLRAREVDPSLSCGSGLPTHCADASTAARTATSAGPFYYVYLLAKIDELRNLAGVQCGITFEGGQPNAIADGVGLDIYDWRLCATLQFPTGTPAWPAPGSGNLITWDPDSRCQGLETAVAGYFYVGAYSPDVLSVVVHPLAGEAKLANCASQERLVPANRLGSVVFSKSGGVPGCNPCLVASCAEPTAVQRSTWSGIKAVLGPSLKPGTKSGSH